MGNSPSFPANASVVLAAKGLPLSRGAPLNDNSASGAYGVFGEIEEYGGRELLRDLRVERRAGVGCGLDLNKGEGG